MSGITNAGGGDLAARLQSHDLRATSTRRWVLECLGRDRYWTVDELATELRPSLPGISTSTIYRTLESLANHGLASVSLVGDNRRRRYARVLESDELHLVCSRCGSMSSHSSTNLEAAITDRVFAADALMARPVVVSVICSDCRPRRDPPVRCD